MSTTISDRQKINRLKLACIVICLINLLALLSLAVCHQLKSEQEVLLQRQANVWRSNAVVQFDIRRAYYTGKGYALALSHPNQQVINLLESWYSKDVDRYQQSFDADNSAQEHIDVLRGQGHKYFSILRTLKKLSPGEQKLLTGDEQKWASSNKSKNQTVDDPRSKELEAWISFAQLYQEMRQKLFNGLEEHYWTVDFAVDKYMALSALAQYIVMAILCLDCLLIVALSAMAVWGPSWAVQFITERAKLPYKFGALVAIPLLTQLLVYGTLSILVAGAASELMRNEKFVHSEDQARNLQKLTFPALGAGEPLAGDAVRAILLQLERFKATSMHNVLIQDWSVEISTTLQEAMHLQPVQREAIIPQFGKPFKNEMYLQLCERILALERMSLPSVGQQRLWEERREILALQAATFERMMLLIAASLVVQIALSGVLLKYFGQAVEARFRGVQRRIEDYAQVQVSEEALPGTDEASVLSEFFLSMAKTIEEAKKREQSMVENASDPIFSLSSELAIVEGNLISIGMYSLQSKTGMNASFLEYVHPDDRESVSLQLKQIRESQTGYFECRIGDNQDVFSDYLVSAQWSDVNQRYFCVCQDITAQKQLDRMKQDFVAMVSHDIRTPLASITIFLEMVNDGAMGELSTNGSDTVSSVIQGSNELTQLIKDLLDIERLHAGRSARESVECDISQFEMEISEQLQGLLEKRQVSIEFLLNSKCLIRGDRDQILQALTSLMVAAVERAQIGTVVKCSIVESTAGKELSISWHHDSQRIRLSQADFETYHPHKQASIGGLSKLGLALARTIIERSGGNVQFLQVQDLCTILIAIPLDNELSSFASVLVADTARSAL